MLSCAGLGRGATVATSSSTPAIRERVEISQEISRGLRWIRAVESCYLATAVVMGLFFLLALGGNAGTGTIVSVGFVFALAALGAFFVERAPVPWTIASAALATVVFVANLVVRLWVSAQAGGDDGPSLRFVRLGMAGVVTAAYWVAVSWARRYQACLRANPALLARRVAGSRVEVDVRGIGTRHRDAARGQELAHRRRRRIALSIGAGAFVEMVAVATAVRLGSGEAESPASAPAPAVPVEPTLLSFERAWNDNRVADVKAMFVAESRTSFSRAFDRSLTKRGWSRLPAISRTRRTDEGEFAAAWYRMEGVEGELYTSWAYDRAAHTWGMNLYRLPRGASGE